LVFSLRAGAAAPDAAGLEFFEKHVRPLLVEHCYTCHSAEAEKVKGGLLLDTREGLLKGGENGPALLPGDPERSLLIKAVRYSDENLQMPPKGKKLAPDQIAGLEAWVKMGAPDPRSGKVETRNPARETRPHWAFQPVKEPAVPAVKNRKLVRAPVDNFLLARLEEKGLAFSPRGDKRTLIRRATFDLTGLPPTAAEVARFEADPSPNAFASLVDRLLASPRYGERWGRYWLDVARYADTKGYVFEEERRYPYSYTYRDWVIRAMNEDLPYDQFLLEQMAADLLPLGDDKRALAALGFLTLGRRFLNNQPDIIDDRIDLVSRGTMGLTVSCARCHDHKFDPIPTKDYYSLYGVFASCNEPNEKPLLGGDAMPREFSEYQAEKKKREVELENYRQAREDDVRTKVRRQVGDYLLAIHDAAQFQDDNKEGFIRQRKLEPALFRHYRRAEKDWSKPSDPIFGPWFRLAAVPETNFAAQAKAICATFATGADASNPPNAAVLAIFSPEAPPETLKDAAGRLNKLFASVDQEWRESQTNATPPARLPDASRETLRAVLYGSVSPILALNADELHRLMDTPVQQKLRALRRKIDETDATHPGAPPRAMALVDNGKPTEPVVFKRGNPNNPGDKVPRQFLEILSGPGRKPFARGSGRLEMAQSIASKDNPLTARVFVNRVWLHHFGAPLVSTPSDFGLRSDPPTHPDLLDYLAARFMADGWSVKKLHRMIMLSAAYQQASDDNPKAAKADPGNQLIWHMNRRRLDFEALRDTLLAVSGKLDLTMGGRAVEISNEQSSPRRTVYGFVERQNLPGLFRTFDFASPDSTSPQRFNTTVPQQALFLMNSPFVVQQAREWLARPEVKAASTDEQKLRELYQIAFQRAPGEDEVKAALRFIASQEASDLPPEPPAWSYGCGHFDEADGRVVNFTPLSHWTGYAWQGGTNLPDSHLGWVLLNADGGHVGNDQNHAAIRRWRAARDGTVRISGELNHPSDRGDGVRARVVSSRVGPLGEWTAKNSKVPVRIDRVEVKRGDYLDFVTDCRQSVEFDSFHWSPVIQSLAAGRARPGRDEPAEWNAKTGFGGPSKPAERRALEPWEKYAQVLLLANELVFVD